MKYEHMWIEFMSLMCNNFILTWENIIRQGETTDLAIDRIYTFLDHIDEAERAQFAAMLYHKLQKRAEEMVKDDDDDLRKQLLGKWLAQIGIKGPLINVAGEYIDRRPHGTQEENDKTSQG